MKPDHVAQLLERLDTLEHLLVINRDHPKEETFSRKMYDLEQKVEHKHEILSVKLDQILEQTTKHNGRMTKAEERLDVIEKAGLVTKGKMTILVLIGSTLATIGVAVIIKIITNFL